MTHRAALDTTAYCRVFLLDTQMVFEARPLEQLPWRELSNDPILLVIPRQVMTEIDAKKRDARLGTRARAFNRLLDPVIESGQPVTLCTGPPRVDLSTMSHSKIDWAALDDLESDSPDDRIVAQALYARIDRPEAIEVLSFDMRPREAARRHGLNAIKPPEDWLLDVEPSPGDKQKAELERRLKVLSANQPELRILTRVARTEPLTYFDVPPLDEDSSAKLLRTIRRRYPRHDSSGPFSAFDRAPGYDDDYRKWSDALAKSDVSNIHRGLSRLFSQYEIEVEIANEGHVTAEHLDLELTASDGRLHPAPIDVLVFGPLPPNPNAHLFARPFLPVEDLMRHRDRDEFYRDSGLGEVALKYVCGDFRHGRTLPFTIYLGLDHAPPKLCIEARATAANLRGDVVERLIVKTEAIPVAVADLVDLDKLAFERDMPELEELHARMEARNDDDIAIFRNDGRRTTRRR